MSNKYIKYITTLNENTSMEKVAVQTCWHECFKWHISDTLTFKNWKTVSTVGIEMCKSINSFYQRNVGVPKDWLCRYLYCMYVCIHIPYIHKQILVSYILFLFYITVFLEYTT